MGTVELRRKVAERIETNLLAVWDQGLTASRRIEAVEALDEVSALLELLTLEDLHDSGVSWARLGNVYGLTGEAVRLRVARARDDLEDRVDWFVPRLTTDGDEAG